MLKKTVISDIEFQPLQVEVINGHFDEAFRRFKSLIQKEKVIPEWKARSFYESPSEKKRRKNKEAEARKFIADNREKLIASGEWDKRLKKKEAKKAKKQAGYVRE